jgi:hypothetical protein
VEPENHGTHSIDGFTGPVVFPAPTGHFHAPAWDRSVTIYLSEKK